MGRGKACKSWMVRVWSAACTWSVSFFRAEARRQSTSLPWCRATAMSKHLKYFFSSRTSGHISDVGANPHFGNGQKLLRSLLRGRPGAYQLLSDQRQRGTGRRGVDSSCRHAYLNLQAASGSEWLRAGPKQSAPGLLSSSKWVVDMRRSE